MKNYILVITPIKHIQGLFEKISRNLNIIYFPNFKIKDLNYIYYKTRSKVIAILTNPNKSNVRINSKLLNYLENLRYVVTASTGTNHIDKIFLKKKKINLISLTKEFSTIKKISSTSELAFALTIAAVRNIQNANLSVKRGKWDYLPFVGRQMNELTVGIIGFGRLGKIYYKYIKTFKSKILVCDPYVKKTKFKKINFVSLKDIACKCDIISLHVHHTKETEKMISNFFLGTCKRDLILINTSRGEIVDEKALYDFLSKKKNSKYYTDVISNEIEGKKYSPIYKNKSKLKNLFITPHIGGMTIAAQKIAYEKVIDILLKKINNLK